MRNSTFYVKTTSATYLGGILSADIVGAMPHKMQRRKAKHNFDTVGPTGPDSNRRYHLLCHVCRNFPNFVPQYLFLRASKLFCDDSCRSYFAMIHIAQYPSKSPSSFFPPLTDMVLRIPPSHMPSHSIKNCS